RSGGRVLCAHGSGSFHRRLRARKPYGPFIEVSETHRSKHNFPNSVSDFFQANVFTSEDVPDGDVLLMPGKAAILPDSAHLEMRGVFEGRQPRGQAARRGDVLVPGTPLGKRVVGAFLVVLASEALEPAVLGDHRRGGRLRGLGFQGAMKALMPAVLLRLSRFDQLGADAQANPPHRQTREATKRRG